MKFWGIFRFEFSYQLRHVLTWLLFAVFLLFGFGVLRIVTLTDETHLNAPATIAFFTVFGSVIWVVMGGAIAGSAATRDMHTRMHPLTYTTAVRKLSYLGGRFLAALGLNALILLLLYAGFLLSFYGPGARTELLGPFRTASYLSGFAFLALPTVFVTTAIQFSFAALSGRAIASYIASIGVIIFSQFGGTTAYYMLEWKVLGGLMDLLGTSLIADMEGWTPIDKNGRLIQLEGIWLWNRLIWFGIAAGALAFTYFQFRLDHLTANRRLSVFFWRRQRTVGPELQVPVRTSHTKSTNISRSGVESVSRDFTFATSLRQVLAIAWTSFKAVAVSWCGLMLVAVFAIGTGLFATEYMEWLGVPLFARTEEVLRVLAPPLSSYRTHLIIIPLLTIFCAGELLWHEREAGLSELSDTTPVPEWVMFLGRFFGLALIITCWVAFLMAAGIINQLVMQYPHFEVDVYLKALFGIQLTNYLLFALGVFVIHVLVNQKFIGHLLAFGVYGFILFSSMLGVEHKLLIYASDPGWSYSDMQGFGPFLKPWLWFKFYWVSWAFLLAVLAMLFWVRSREGSLRGRLYLAQTRFSRHKPALMLALVLVLLSGGFIFYNTNVLNEYSNKADRMKMRADYERRYGQYEHTIQPVLTRTLLQVDIFPEEQTADIRGTYQLVNRSKSVIDSIHLSTIPQFGMAAVFFDREASPLLVDDALGYHIYLLKNPLKAGDSIQLSFEFHIKPHGFSNSGVGAAIVANGSHIDSDTWMPVIGYDDDRSLRKASDREKWGLPVRPAVPSLYDVAARYNNRHAGQIEFEAVVSTSEDQTAVAPGALRRSWTKGDRRYFHYVTNAPIHTDYAFFSARYALREAQWVPQQSRPVLSGADSLQDYESSAKPVTIQVFYHPTHEANVERMLKSAQASLAYFTDEFGPYPYTHFRVLERPGAGRGMHADPMTIDYEEGYSLMNPAPGGLDLPYHIMAHEVAHQWWGLSLSPAAVEGSGLLVESLATYAAMQVVEETLGYEHLLRYLSQMRQEYEVPHSRAAPPLLQANNRFMNYRKGPFALYALRNYIGKDKVNDALRELLNNYTANPPLPTTLDLYRELQSVTPDSLQYLVHDLFAANTFWELETKEAAVIQTKAGSWQLRLEVEAQKMTVDSIGVETKLSMDDWIEIGVFAPAGQGENPGNQLYLQKHRIHSGKQTITLTVPGKPHRAGIDPRHLLIDLDVEDNTRKVKTDGKKEGLYF